MDNRILIRLGVVASYYWGNYEEAFELLKADFERGGVTCLQTDTSKVSRNFFRRQKRAWIKRRLRPGTILMLKASLDQNRSAPLGAVGVAHRTPTLEDYDRELDRQHLRG